MPSRSGRGGARSARRPVAVDFFCGAGGMSLGFEQAGFDVVAAIDSDPVHLATYSYNFPTAAVLCGDATTMAPDAVLEAARRGWEALHPGEAWDGTIDCAFGGPSCQGFSSIGKRDPDDERNSLVHHFARFVVALKPAYFVMENVPGILEPQNAEALSTLVDSLRSAGYTLVGKDPMRLDAKSFGVPQTRKRVFVVGARKGHALPQAPSPLSTAVTVAQALDDLVDADEYDALLWSDSARLHWRTVEVIERRVTAYVASLRNGGPDGSAAVGLQYPRVWDPRWLTASGRTQHSAAVRARFRRTAPGAEETVARLPRLDGEGQATTLRAGTGRDHGSFTSARPIHHRYDRVVTVREAARLHSFPDWFRFHVTKWHGFRQVGNSVPPGLAHAVAAAIVAAADHEVTPPRSPLELGDPELLEHTLLTAADHFDLDHALLPPDSRRRAKGPVRARP